MSSDQTLLLPLLVVLTTAVAALLDLRTGHIPNWLTLGALLAGMLAHVSLGLGATGLPGAAHGLLGSTLGAALTAAVPMLLYRAGGVGGGDVKLLAAIGAACGVAVGLQIELYAFAIAAVYVGARMAFRGALLQALRAAASLIPGLLWARKPNPLARGASLGELRFGPSVLAASCVALVSHWSGAP